MTNRTDNFNRANVTSPLGTPSDGGSAWTTPGGAHFGITSNTAYNSNGGSQEISCLESGISDCDVQVTFATVGGSSDCGICARFVDTTNYIVLAATVGTGYRLFKLVGGGFTQIGSTYATGPTSGDVCKLTLNGSSLEVFVNGVSRITGTDSAHLTATLHGIRASGDTASRFDEFSITALGGGGGTGIDPQLKFQSSLQSAGRASIF